MKPRVTQHDSDPSSREQYKADERCDSKVATSQDVFQGHEELDALSECELMTDRQHEVHLQQHEKGGHVQDAVDLPTVDSNHHGQLEHVPGDSTSGSSMHRGLPVLLALAAASSTSSTTSHVGGQQAVIRPIVSTTCGGTQEEEFIQG